MQFGLTVDCLSKQALEIPREQSTFSMVDYGLLESFGYCIP